MLIVKFQGIAPGKEMITRKIYAIYKKISTNKFKKNSMLYFVVIFCIDFRTILASVFFVLI